MSGRAPLRALPRAALLLARPPRALLAGYSGPARLYWLVLVVGAAALLLPALATLARGVREVPTAVIPWAALAASLWLSSQLRALPARQPLTGRMAGVLHQAVLLLVLALQGPAGAVCAAGLEALAGAWRDSRRWSSRLATTALAVLSIGGAAALAAWPLGMAAQGGGAAAGAWLLAGLALAATTAAVLPAALAAALLRLKDGRVFSAGLWWQQLGRALPPALAAALLATLARLALARVDGSAGPALLVLLAGLLAVALLAERLAGVRHTLARERALADARLAEQAQRHLDALRRIEHRLAVGFQEAAIGMALLDADDRIVHVNRALAELWAPDASAASAAGAGSTATAGIGGIGGTNDDTGGRGHADDHRQAAGSTPDVPGGPAGGASASAFPGALADPRAQALAGRLPMQHLLPPDAARLASAIDRLRDGSLPRFTLEGLRGLAADGRPLWLDISAGRLEGPPVTSSAPGRATAAASPVATARHEAHSQPDARGHMGSDTASDSEAGFLVLQVHDSSARHLAEQRLAHARHHDALTGLPHRGPFLQALAEAHARQAAGGSGLALLLLDLDHFRAANARHGHAAGDAWLQAVAGALRELAAGSPPNAAASSSAGWQVARLGGDTFALLGPADAPAAADVAERALASVAALTGAWAPPDGPQPSASAGLRLLAAGEPATAEATELLAEADAALRAAKAAGRGGWRRFEPAVTGAGAQAQQAAELAAELAAAIAADAIELAFQPMHRLGDDRALGWEALARWPHPRLGPLPAERWLPLAESEGLLPALAQRVLARALQGLQRLQGGAAGDRSALPCVAVNLCGPELCEPGFVAGVLALLQRHRLQPAQLQIELTEARLQQHGEALEAPLRALRALGVGLVVDDFGSGHLSLSRLARLPVDALKIGASHVQALGDDAQAAERVRNAVQVGRAMGRRVAAGGIEAPQQLAALQRLGCRQGQGRLLGEARPAPPPGG